MEEGARSRERPLDQEKSAEAVREVVENLLRLCGGEGLICDGEVGERGGVRVVRAINLVAVGGERWWGVGKRGRSRRKVEVEGESVEAWVEKEREKRPFVRGVHG